MGKFLYRTIISFDKDIALDKYLIIYQNDDYTYYKVNGSKRLQEIFTRHIYNTIEDAKHAGALNVTPFGKSVYTYEKPDIHNLDFSDSKIESLNSQIKIYDLDIARIERAKERVLDEIKKIKKGN